MSVECVVCDREIRWEDEEWQSDVEGGWCTVAEGPHVPRMPEGFHAVAVLISDKERREMESERLLSTTRATYSEVIRKRLGWSEQPYGLVTRKKEQKEWHLKGPRAMLPIRKGPGPGTDTSKRRSLR